MVLCLTDNWSLQVSNDKIKNFIEITKILNLDYTRGYGKTS